MSRRLPRRHAAKRGRDGIGQTAVVIGIGAVLLLFGVFATGEYVMTARREPTLATTAPGTAATAPSGAMMAAAAPGDSVIYRGSVLFMPEFGRYCRQLFFSNLTGRFTDNGKVDCLSALAEAGFVTQTQLPDTKFRAISDSFRH